MRYMVIERFTEGDRREHLLRDREPWSVNKVARKAAKHFLWLMVAWWTGGAWVLYFADAPTLVKELATGEALLIDRGHDTAVHHERSAGIVSVPDPENGHGAAGAIIPRPPCDCRPC